MFRTRSCSACPGYQDPRLLQYEGFQTAIQNIITNFNLTAPNAESPDSEHFAHFGKLKYKFRTLSRNSAIGRCRNLERILCNTQNEIIDLELLPRTLNTSAELTVLYKQLKKTHEQLSDKAYIKASITRADNFEKSTKSFFNLAKPPRIRTRLEHLTTADGSTTNDPEIIEETTCTFFEQVFNHKDTDSIHQTTLVNSISTQVPRTFYSLMAKPITSEEVTFAISQSGNNKTPGPDGFTAEFYKAFSTQLSPILANIYNRCQHDIPISMKEAVICLLFKKGDKSQLKNWRTISLLNVDYKILTKILNHRIKLALP